MGVGSRAAIHQRPTGVVALIGKQCSAKLSPSPELPSQVCERYQSVEDQFQAATGYGLDALTESEARALIRAGSLDTARDRIFAAGQRSLIEAQPGVFSEARPPSRAQVLEARGIHAADNGVVRDGGTGYTDQHEDPYSALETRPKTKPAQLDAGRAALASAERRIFGADGSKLLAGASLLGSSVSADFRTKGGTSLVGQVIESAQDLAFCIFARSARD